MLGVKIIIVKFCSFLGRLNLKEQGVSLKVTRITSEKIPLPQDMKNSLKSNSGTCPVKSQISHLSQAGINLFYLDRFNKMKSLSKFGESWRWMYSKIAEHLEQRSKSVLKLRLYKWGIMTTFDNRNIFKIWKKQNKSTNIFFLWTNISVSLYGFEWK